MLRTQYLADSAEYQQNPNAVLLLLEADPLAGVENLASISVTETIELLAAGTNADASCREIGRGRPCCGLYGALRFNC